MYTLPLLVTVYDTALCEPNIRCLQGNGDGLFASMIPVAPEWYGRMAACDPSLFGHWISIDGIGEVYCGDNFGMLDGIPVETITMIDGEWVVRIDIFWPVNEQGYPEWNYYRFYNWEVLP